MKFRHLSISPLAISILTAMFLSGCSYWEKSQTSLLTEKLQRIVKQYNLALETHDPSMGSIFVNPEHVEDYINDVEKIRKRVTFNKSTLVNVKYSFDGEPIKQVYMQPLEGEIFNEAEVTMRYELVISPSNTVKTKILKQQWVSSGDVWFLTPDIESYFK
ncbi:MAG: hypothetical protein ACQ9MH_08485 [Nitrospinales bacterium]